MAAAEHRARLLRRYRVPLVLAVPVGVLLGALIGTALYLSSSDDVRTADRAMGWLSYTLALGAGLGGAVAGIAAIGAVIGVLLHTRHHPAATSPVLPVAIGAAVTVTAATTSTGLVIALASGSGGSAALAGLAGGALLGPLAAACAALTTTATLQRQNRRTAQDPLE